MRVSVITEGSWGSISWENSGGYYRLWISVIPPNGTGVFIFQFSYTQYCWPHWVERKSSGKELQVLAVGCCCMYGQAWGVQRKYGQGSDIIYYSEIQTKIKAEYLVGCVVISTTEKYNKAWNSNVDCVCV